MVVLITYDRFGVNILEVSNSYTQNENFYFKYLGKNIYEFPVERLENETPYMFSKRIVKIAKKNIMIMKLKSC
jgi:hypothetical protein